MNYQPARIWGSVVAILAIGLNASSAIAAEGKKPKAEPFATAEDRPVQVGIEGVPGDFRYQTSAPFHAAAAVWGVSDAYGGRGVANVTDSIRKSAEAVRDAKDDDEKITAQKVLEERLSKYFDDDMTQRESELAKIEERLTKLRELLERRRAKKQEIIDLQAKVALNEADGLGFYNTERQGKGGAFGAFSSPVPVQVLPPLPAKVAAPEAVPTPPTPPAGPTPTKR